LPASKPTSIETGAEAPAAAPGKTPWWIKAFVWFHLACIVSWTLPAHQELYDKKRPQYGTNAVLAFNAQHIRWTPIVRGYLFGSGFWQYWDMFAPNPSDTDTYGDALVKFKDGTEKVYWYPRIRDVAIPGKLPIERYRKFYERAGSESTSYLWRPFAQRVANQMYKDPQNPPVLVTLRSHSRKIARPGKPPITDYTETIYFRFVVDPAELGREG